MPTVSMGKALRECGEAEETAAKFDHITLPFEPMPHQKEGYQLARNDRRSGLFFEPRTGKTLVLQMLAIFNAYHGTGTIQIMPPGLFRQFLHDYEQIKHHGMRIAVLSATPGARRKLLETWNIEPDKKPHVVLLSQVIFKGVWHDLLQLGFTCVHFDEAHNGLQTYASQIAKQLRGFRDVAGTRLVLSTGTPIPNQVRNVYPTINLINPGAYWSQTAFDSYHCVFRTLDIPDPRAFSKVRKISVIDSYRNLDVLSANLYKHAIHASKREILALDAPNITITECELNSKHRALYRKILNERLLELPGGEILDARSVQAVRQTALQLISVPERFSDTVTVEHNSLYQTLDALLETYDPARERVVLFANYVETVRALERRYARYHPATVYGPNGPQKNAEEVERFHKDPSCRLLVANPGSGSTGFKLGDVAKVVIFAEPVSTPGMFDQCISRVMLIGQTEPVIVHIIKVVGTISQTAIPSMLRKAGDVESVNRTKKSLFESLMGKGEHLEDSGAYSYEEREAA